MADPVDDQLLNQIFPGEFCRISVGSENQSLIEYSAFITNYSRTGFSNSYANERTAGTSMVSREGISSGQVSFDAVFVGSLPKISTYNVSSPSSGYTEYKLDSSDKKFKIKLEFQESSSGSPGSPIQTSDYAYKEVFYNSRGMTFDVETSSTSYLKAKVSFWVPPFDDLGSSNFRSLDKAVGVNLTQWGARETAWNSDIRGTWV